MKEKKESEKSANTTSKYSMKDDSFTLITIPTDDASHIENSEEVNFALVIPSRYNHKAHSVTPSVGVIINCGTSSHFSPDKSKFLDSGHRS